MKSIKSNIKRVGLFFFLGISIWSGPIMGVNLPITESTFLNLSSLLVNFASIYSSTSSNPKIVKNLAAARLLDRIVPWVLPGAIFAANSAYDNPIDWSKEELDEIVKKPWIGLSLLPIGLFFITTVIKNIVTDIKIFKQANILADYNKSRPKENGKKGGLFLGEILTNGLVMGRIPSLARLQTVKDKVFFLAMIRIVQIVQRYSKYKMIAPDEAFKGL